jgi:ADP-ribose pyrophosphatase YjhB (NUDIX family)
MASTETATLTADTVIVTRGHDDMPLVWLIRIVKPAFQGRWAIPGGKLAVGETFTEAAVREAAEETTFGSRSTSCASSATTTPRTVTRAAATCP